MKHTIDLTAQIDGTYWHAAAILKLDRDPIIKAPLEELRFEIGGGAITRRVQATLGAVVYGHDNLLVPLHWNAAEHPHLFPVMDAQLGISDVGGKHIGLHLVGEYQPPLGAIGAAGDALAGHHVAENSLRGFLAEVAQRLEAELVEHAGRVGVKR
jgi:hypothetical protein